jgi:ankyrin repeat protein
MKGLDVETKGKDGWTPLMVAAAGGHVKAMEVSAAISPPLLSPNHRIPLACVRFLLRWI